MNDTTIKGPLRILRLQAENVKRLVAVDITPKGDVVQIAGRNGQGKSSTLDAILWALAGRDKIQDVPIRNGEEKARIRLDLGECVVTRTFKKKDSGETTTAVIVEAADGTKFGSPQELLNSFLSELCFDPLAFARMKPKEQFDALRRFVPDVDFDALDAANKADFDRRTAVNRQAKEARSAADMIAVPPNAPTEAVDDAALIAEMRSAGDRNTETERRRARRQETKQLAERYRKGAQQYLDRIAVEIEQIRNRAEAEIARIRQQADEQVESVTTSQTALSNGDTKKAEELEAQLAGAAPLPDLIDTAALQAQIDAARVTNTAVQKAAERTRYAATADKYEAEAKALTKAMEARDRQKRDAIKAAKMPIAGLDFGIGCVLLNKLPLDQASDAERLRTSAAIAMAGEPTLRVCRIREGSLLDDDGMKLIADMAADRGFQVWIEKVAADGKIGFIIEDGHARSAAE